jgi:hypothetical protein
MGIHTATVSTTTLVNTAIPAAETAVLTTPALSPGLDNASVFLWWWLQLATGAGGTAITWTLRRGSGIGGASVITGTLTSVASTNIWMPGCWVDSPGVVGGQQYTLTLNDNGAAGVVAFGSMLGVVL